MTAERLSAVSAGALGNIRSRDLLRRINLFPWQSRPAIKDVTAICFAEVIRQLRRHQSVIPGGLFICFNTSSVNFQDDEIVTLCQTFIQQMKEAQVRLVLEITERESIENTRQTSAVTDKLQAYRRSVFAG